MFTNFYYSIVKSTNAYNIWKLIWIVTVAKRCNWTGSQYDAHVNEHTFIDETQTHISIWAKRGKITHTHRTIRLHEAKLNVHTKCLNDLFTTFMCHNCWMRNEMNLHVLLVNEPPNILHRNKGALLTQC